MNGWTWKGQKQKDQHNIINNFEKKFSKAKYEHQEHI